MKRFVFTFLICCSALIGTAQTLPNDTTTITAHSGAFDTPDNSMEYIETAIAHHADILEFDVRMRPNGTIAMAHDTITSNEDGTDILPVLKYIKKDPHLARINLDIKQISTLPQLYQMILESDMKDRVFMTGIEVNCVEAARRDCPGIAYYLNYEPDPNQLRTPEQKQALLDLLEKTGSVGVNCDYHGADEALVELLHSHGYQLSIWTLNKEEDMPRYIRLHPDNITTRHPLLVQKVKMQLK